MEKVKEKGTKSGVSAKDNRLRNMKVEDKFRTTFKKLQWVIIGTFLVIVIMIGVLMRNLDKMNSVYYVQNSLQAELRTSIQAYAKSAWFALTTRDEAVMKEQVEHFTEKIPEMKDDLTKLRKVYDNKELLDEVEGDLKELEALTTQLKGFFDAGHMTELGNSNGADIYTTMQHQITPLVADMAADMKAVAEDSKSQAAMGMQTSIIISITFTVISLALVIFSVLFMAASRRNLTESILQPVQILSKASEEMAKGNLNLDLEYDSEDELGQLAKDLKESTSATAAIVTDIGETLEKIAGGDFSSGSANPSIYKQDFAPISSALEDITARLSETIGKVKHASSQVAAGATNMSEGATALAEGATDQAAAVEELTANVATVTEQTQAMADAATEGIKIAQKVQSDVTDGEGKMQLVTEAMSNITGASQEIAQIADTIEAIANQTQLLALNASIEAARAGEAGRGFAVVAEEIGALANQSSDAVNNTHQLIKDTLDQIGNGNTVVNETRDALNRVKDSVDEVARMMETSGEMAATQAQSMAEINDGIEQISNVIQNNSATAQQSSAVAQELSDQSGNLNELIGEFRIKE